MGKFKVDVAQIKKWLHPFAHHISDVVTVVRKVAKAEKEREANVQKERQQSR